MNRLIDRQVRWNAGSRGSWELAAPHRARVTRLIVDGAKTAAAELCVLGAGNCNDLNLSLLIAEFAQIHLVDLDAAALQAAVEFQQVDSTNIHLQGDCDLTGICDALSVWRPDSLPDAASLAAIVDAAERYAGPDIPAPFDVVASVCLLSQMIEAVVATLGDDHPRFLELVRAVRLRHLKLLLQLTRAGGIALLITDIVSSDVVPQLGSIEPQKFAGEVAQMVAEKRFFHGLNPAVLSSLLETDQALSSQIEHVRYAHPWLWDFGARQYAVTAFAMVRASPV